jgi:hypothetical protein
MRERALAIGVQHLVTHLDEAVNLLASLGLASPVEPTPANSNPAKATKDRLGPCGQQNRSFPTAQTS